MDTRIHPQRTRAWSRGTLVAIASAVGLVVGLRTITRIELPKWTALISVRPIPREEIGVSWSSRAFWPADVQAVALETLIGFVAMLAFAAAAVASLNALILLAESSVSRRGELAVRAAVGATPRRLVAMLLAELKTLFAAAFALGLVIGLVGGGAARAAWPGPRLPVHPWAGATDPTWAVGLLLAILAGAYVVAGVKLVGTSRTAEVLRGGTRLSGDPGAVFARKALAATHVATAGAVLVGALTLASALGDLQNVAQGAERTVAIEGTAPGPGAWKSLLDDLREMPGLQAESLATPGALTGLGVRDVITAECGQCVIGLMPTPIVTAFADHHAVSDGYFDLAGIQLLQGRTFGPQDDGRGPPVAIVSRAFANSSFEDGQPLGRRVRIGTGLYDWFTVVGVVEDVHVPVLGSEEVEREAVYVSALQHPPRSGVLLLQGEALAVERARLGMAHAGFSPGEPRSLRRLREEAGSALRWTYWVASLLSLITLLLAAHGVYVAALQTTRRRTPELSVRRVLGASSGRIVRHVLSERLRVSAWGLGGLLFFGPLVGAMLVGAAGLRPLGPGRYAEVALVLVITAMAASVRAAREALTVEPATTLE